MRQLDTFDAIVSGRQKGPMAGIARTGLRVASAFYGRVIGVRNAFYDTWAFPNWLEIPVVSIGNLTVGGTGKTPMTIWMCEQLLARGLKPGVLSRGYKASAEGVADELLLVSRRCPQAVAVAHADRGLAGAMAIAEYGIQVAILDDGFQHRRVGRDLDIVLVDATLPFGYGHMLPRGYLREPIKSIRRAEAVVITRCDQAAPQQVEHIERTIREWSREMPIVRAIHEPSGFVDLAGGSPAKPAGARPGLLAGIARPAAFAQTLATMAIPAVANAFFADHHVYTDSDVDSLKNWVRDQRLDCILTTEKDAVKLARIQAAWPVPVFVLGVQIRLLNDGQQVLEQLLDEMLRHHADDATTERELRKQ